ncbi:glycoside hydrolase family 9 [Halorhabdus utahensis DSM 12940]|uniref:Glycoside hydrolase family 9 n=1 Tax=Halorhabdus utahensis (strain DSM 12940 / JCM 11049 / AX-2) TaxID=519442 RepID=C7NMC6_HALUD|nr:glycoside hydrolase family 9 protein [Halorhabdus utahensis]ACV12565.1 glycoside hydrolase family 9 [Halorhabdus utahensis DSM 12940]
MTEHDAKSGGMGRTTTDGDTDLFRRDLLAAMGLGAGSVALGTDVATPSVVSRAAAQTDLGFDYAHALQQSLYFYDANRCGATTMGNRLQWRGECHHSDTEIPLDAATEDGGTNLSGSFIEEYSDVLDPDGTGTIDVSGGFHDAGDHMKFGLPQSYSASTLSWALYEFEDAFRDVGSYDHMVDILRHFADYFLKSTFRDDEGNVVAFCYHVGEGSIDHNYWGPPELQSSEEYPRPAYFATPEDPASDQCAGTAAALTITSLVLESEDSAYAAECLDTAQALYDFAVENRGLGYDGGFYDSSYDEDELSWAAVWLHIATEDDAYLDDILATDDSGTYTGYLGEIIDSTDDDWQNIWVHSWDTVWGGVFLKLAPITDDPEHWQIARWNLEYLSGGSVEHEDDNDTNYASTSDAGFTVLNTWGSARYNAAAQFQAMVYRKYRDTEKAVALTDWAATQMNYIMGDNSFGYSLIVGFTDDHAEHPHHRAAHGSKENSMEEPEEHRHTLWGALVGGPDEDDTHVDETSDYVYNEVAIDFNAGLVGALAGFNTFYDDTGEAVAEFPPGEEPIDAYYAEGEVLQENADRTQVRVTIHNESIHPPHREDGLSARYFIDVSELRDAGQSIDAVSVEVQYDQQSTMGDGSADVSGPIAWDEDAGIYYIELDWSGNQIYGAREIQISMIAEQDDNWESNWDPSNDPSFQDIGEAATVTEAISVYLDGELVYGQLPGESESEPDDTTAPTAPSNLSVVETTASSAEVEWEAASDEGGSGLDHYTISVAGDFDQQVGAGTTTATVEELDAETTYEIGVSAVDGAGNESDTVTVEATTDEADDGEDDSDDEESPTDALVVNDYDGDPAWSSNRNDLGQWCGAGSFENGAGEVADGALVLEYDNGGWYQEQINRDVSDYSSVVLDVCGANGGEENEIRFAMGGVSGLLGDLTGDSIGTSAGEVRIDMESAGIDPTAEGLAVRLNFWQGGESTLAIEAIRLE